jgi:Rieske Fe-S protein
VLKCSLQVVVPIASLLFGSVFTHPFCQTKKDVLALASAEFDLSNIPVGNTVTVKWRGKPVFIKHRSAAEIAECNGADVSSMRDPEADSVRVKEVGRRE